MRHSFFRWWSYSMLSKQRFALLLSVCAGILTIALLAVDVIHIRFSVIVILAVCFVLSFARLEEVKSASILKRIALFWQCNLFILFNAFSHPVRIGDYT